MGAFILETDCSAHWEPPPAVFSSYRCNGAGRLRLWFRTFADEVAHSGSFLQMLSGDASRVGYENTGRNIPNNQRNRMFVSIVFPSFIRVIHILADLVHDDTASTIPICEGHCTARRCRSGSHQSSRQAFVFHLKIHLYCASSTYPFTAFLLLCSNSSAAVRRSGAWIRKYSISRCPDKLVWAFPLAWPAA